MKIQRLGNTEFNLIFSNFCKKKCNLTLGEINKTKQIDTCFVDWLYKTAGYYDKNVKKNNNYLFPEDYTKNFETFLNNLELTIKNSTEVYALGLQDIINLSNNHPLFKYIEQFEKYHNIKLIPYNIDILNILRHLTDKKVLVISPFKELIDLQIQNKNLEKLYPSLKNSRFITYKFPYTFQNDGPHNNFFETLEYIKSDIKNNYSEFDIAILSCGCYGSFIVDMICEEMKKDAIYIGGQLPLIFGIIGKRDKWAIEKYYKDKKECIIDGIPEKYKPTCWQKIEDGCYW